MKKRFLILPIIFMLFMHGAIFTSNIVPELPLETAILKLPENDEANWWEISRAVNKIEGLVESIPLCETIENWSELVCIHYFDRSILRVDSIENIANNIRTATVSSYPGSKVTWKIIEKNKNDIIYEWILHNKHKTIPPQHEISRLFLTNQACHRIGFTRRNKLMSSEERTKWIKLLKENASVISFDKGYDSEGLSMADKPKEFLSLEANFQDWNKINNWVLENGYTFVTYVPPTHTGTYVTECLEIYTVPNFPFDSIHEMFELEKSHIQRGSSEEVEFHVLQKSSKEVIYTYCHPKDLLELNAVARMFLADYGYYSISYKHGLKEQMPKEEVLKWVEKLKSIKVNNLKNNKRST